MLIGMLLLSIVEINANRNVTTINNLLVVLYIVIRQFLMYEGVVSLTNLYFFFLLSYLSLVLGMFCHDCFMSKKHHMLP